tara:strand:+ start:3019 stop:3822 length:804 start_codon:yes stop_codon:yes gene_type:complete
MTSSQVQVNETPPMSAQDIEGLKDDNGLIAGKFKTVEDMVNSYKELEGKLGGIEDSKPEESTEETPKAETEETQEEWNPKEIYGEGLASVLEEVGIDTKEITDTFTDTGKITEDHYSKLEEAGFSKQVIDTYLDGIKGSASSTEDIKQSQLEDIQSVVGGEQGYEELKNWTQNNLPAETLQSFDKILDTQDPAIIKIAVQGFAAQMREAEGYEPSLINGRSPTSATNTFKTAAEIQTAMSDPRYNRDEAYTQSVYNRLKDSTVLNNG